MHGKYRYLLSVFTYMGQETGYADAPSCVYDRGR